MPKFEFFAECMTLEDVKKTYKRLCFKYHPDIFKGDNGETMKRVNVEYEKAFAFYKNNVSRETTKASETNVETTETPEQFQEIINSLVNMTDIEIDIIGCFIWIGGNTYPYKDRLKALNFHWAKYKRRWCWHTDDYKATKHKPVDYENIKSRYGCTKVKTKKQVCFNT